MQKRALHSLLGLSGQKVKSRVAVEEGYEVATRGRWVTLPPVPPAPKGGGLLACLEPTQVSAITWLKRCCPYISQNDAETLLLSGQVKVYRGSSLASDFEETRLKRVKRKDILSEGSVLCLPAHSMLSVEGYLKRERLKSIPKIGLRLPERDKEDDSVGEF